jgi:cysteine desulfurase
VARHYLDHASTSPLRPEAREAMVAWLERDDWADPSRLHEEGMTARHAVEQARQAVATHLGARPREVVFTSGATEAIVAAVWGAAERGGHVVVSAVEHSAVRLAAEAHAEVTVVASDGTGRVDPADVLAALRPDTALVAVQWGNHEVGTVQDVPNIVSACRARGVLTLVDAAQAVGRAAVDFGGAGADLLAVSAHKEGGPGGLGALLVRRGLRLRPLLVGSDQERARRAGLEPTAAIVGWGALAAAAPAGTEVLAAEAARQDALTRRLRAGLQEVDGVTVVGHPTLRLPHLTCCVTEGVEPQAVLLGLDRVGVAAHSGSACASEDLLPSPVLAAMGVDAHHSLRLSVGWSTTDADVDAALAALPAVLAGLRRLGRAPSGDGDGAT